MLMIVDVDGDDYSSGKYLTISSFFSKIVNEGCGSLLEKKLGEERMKCYPYVLVLSTFWENKRLFYLLYGRLY